MPRGLRQHKKKFNNKNYDYLTTVFSKESRDGVRLTAISFNCYFRSVKRGNAYDIYVRKGKKKVYVRTISNVK